MIRVRDELPLGEFRRRYARGGGAWTNAVNQSIGAAIARVAMRRDVHPNVLSLLNALVGLATSGAVMITFQWSPIAAGMIGVVGWQLAYSVDCADGQVARATGRATEEGAVLDLLCDYLVQLSVLAVVAGIATQAVEGAVASSLGVMGTGLWLLSPYYSGIASQRLTGRERFAEMGGLRSLMRLARDYGLQVFLVALAVGVAPAAVILVLIAVGLLNLLFAIERIRRFAGV